MPKKVLILSSSPRKGGNSDILCEEFKIGATSAGHNVEKIFLKDKEINYCSGCGLCVNNNQAGCFKKDDMSEILDKMIEADVIVFGTPVYFYTMCAQMKTLIDRCCAKYTKISNKEFYIIATAADTNIDSFERIFDEFRGFLSCLPGAIEAGHLPAPGVWTKGEVRNSPFAEKARRMGENV